MFTDMLIREKQRPDFGRMVLQSHLRTATKMCSVNRH